ncbi:hypothetical protein TNCV_3848131 [Trichonephila clavipes]|uniref:Uncharacterized protein n=1 Tax=Trichonephila clavipes TaxID=2585209 RepID=A0A8X6UWB7_TRICX|nr:hypothetical protein TNCV_3848131 [Trichonephila clavipes]
MRSTKDQLVKKDVLMPVKHNVFLWNLPDVEEMPSHDGETILLWSPWKYRCGQRTVRMAVVACSQKQRSLRAQAHQSKSRTETCELVKVKQKLLEMRAELEREKRERESAERQRHDREHLGPPEKSGVGPPSWILRRVGILGDVRLWTPKDPGHPAI